MLGFANYAKKYASTIYKSLGGGPSFGSERTIELSRGKLRLPHTPSHQSLRKQRRPRIFQSVNAGRRWRGKYCFASRGEGYPETITFFNIPGI